MIKDIYKKLKLTKYKTEDVLRNVKVDGQPMYEELAAEDFIKFRLKKQTLQKEHLKLKHILNMKILKK